MRPFADVATARNIVANKAVQFGQVDALILELHGEHAAADVDTYDIGDDFVGNRHRRSNDTTLAGVDIGHDANLTTSTRR